MKTCFVLLRAIFRKISRKIFQTGKTLPFSRGCSGIVLNFRTTGWVVVLGNFPDGAIVCTMLHFAMLLSCVNVIFIARKP